MSRLTASNNSANLPARFRHGLPLIKNAFALEENPLASDMLRRNLQLHAVIVTRFQLISDLGMIKR